MALEKKRMKKNTKLVSASLLVAMFLLGIPALTPHVYGAAAPCLSSLKCGIVILGPGTGGALNKNQTVNPSFLVTFFVQNITIVQPGTNTDVNTTTTGTGQNPTHNEGHIHVFVDGVYYTLWASSNGIPITLTPGTHTVKLDLVNDFHQEFNPAISASTTVNVIDRLAPIQSTANNAQTYSLIGIVISIITLILVAYVAFRPKPKSA